MAQVTVEYERWMKDIIGSDGTKGKIIGSVVGSPNVFAVSIKPSGATRFYCSTCRSIFPIRVGQCPECGKQDVNQK